ncbi:hypothetical protein AYO21_02977 [Fonsecaea monophora]|uniref:Amino acid permease/ SLC12A domain-containing protein n=1 Tax=Fonsecaea monophora TaxID=254056 RepID=A0A177FEI4_9EURO|nr:hypothetical protein AYO21_02977 [Fonsecaea monophora]KAH0841964.1 General amino acid permease AGP2 [Fonsecaea pedrosoi]OAG42694.1 hypothetical protein AYO21_02977 [Fonsecaea monophora]
MEKDTKSSPEPTLAQVPSLESGVMLENADQLSRRLNNRQVQLIAVGGAVGTALFISIGGALTKGGPLSLLLAYTFYSCVMAMVNNCIAEMATLHPVAGGFVRMAGKWVDEAFGFMAGWNFFFYEALVVPFEITAMGIVIGFWSDNVPIAAVCAGCIVVYVLINSLTVRAYGEAEFWLSGGKVILIFILFSFTFVTMVGGNPKHDAYGFRYWKDPGSMTEYLSSGNLGRFEGLLACLWSAAFTIVGPEYISMASAETKRPRIYIKTAFKTVYWRFGAFFIVGALAVGIVVPYNDPTLVGINNGTQSGGGTGAASPYVIAMANLGIGGLPHLVNALICTSIFSAGNTYFYAATRALYGLSLEGRAPAFLKKCTKRGVPLYCVAVTAIFPCLSFLSLSSGSAVVLNWLINLVTAGSLINFVVILITYLVFYNACKAQGVDRRTFPYFAWGQPYCAWVALVSELVILFFFGYTSFDPPSADTFFSCYTMVVLAPFTYGFWKLFKKTKFVKAREVDLVWERPVIDAYEDSFVSPPVGFWTETVQIFGFKRDRVDDDRRRSVTA